jgi:hypothetical protein
MLFEALGFKFIVQQPSDDEIGDNGEGECPELYGTSVCLPQLLFFSLITAYIYRKRIATYTKGSIFYSIQIPPS